MGLRAARSTLRCPTDDASSEPGSVYGMLPAMDFVKMVEELRTERAPIEEAIMALERLARGHGKRRGRPPAWMTATKRRGRPPGSKNKPKAEVAA